MFVSEGREHGGWKSKKTYGIHFCCKGDYFSLDTYCISASTFIRMFKLLRPLQIAGSCGVLNKYVVLRTLILLLCRNIVAFMTELLEALVKRY